MSLLPSTQAFSIPDNHCNTLSHTLPLDAGVTLAAVDNRRCLQQGTIVILESKNRTEASNSRCECGTSHTRSAFCRLLSVLHWNVTGIRTLYSDLSVICSERSLTFYRRTRRISRVFLSVWWKNRMKIDIWGAAGWVCLRTDKNTHQYNKRYPDDMSQQQCHYLRLRGETTMFWEYHMGLRVLS